jgi:hypothetical protein
VSIASLTPTPARFIDPRGQRFGAAVSAVVLAIAFLLAVPWLATLVGLNLLVSAAFGTRLFLPGRAWPLIRRTLKLGPAEPEHEYPPRFAQAMGGTFLVLATLAFVLGLAPLGWLLPSPSRPSRSCSRRPGSASAAGSTSCAGGFRRSSRGSPAGRTRSGRRSRRCNG